MPATTRSSTKQAHTDNPAETKQAVTDSKRKAPRTESKVSPSKKRKAGASAEPKAETDDKTYGNRESHVKEDAIIINRAPVLELWGSCVASLLYPALPWETCLSAGSAISTLCAVSKGRAIGTIEPSDPEKAERSKQERRERAGKEYLEELEVMGFKLKLKDGQAIVGDKPKKGNEALLRKKFGEESFDRAKAGFNGALSKWKGEEEELDSKAFHFYEVFRPNVAKGQHGWGRKGELNIETMHEVVGDKG